MSTTLRSLIGSLPVTASPSGLGDWYTKVADTPIEQLTTDDLCRAMRQRLALEHLVPLAVNEAKSDANAGSLFDGELVSVLARIPRSFWLANPGLLDATNRALNNATGDFDDDVKQQVVEFARMATEILAGNVDP